MHEKSKDADLEPFRKDSSGQPLTTDQGVPVHDNQNSLTAGERGPTLMEDFIFREKMTHFDHEEIPERVVHARGSGAHGYFEVYESLAELTRAHFLQDPSVKTPVFVRFSTVVGSRGSADTVRDVRGFATKFYTQEGNFDLVGNNVPIFFIQDAIKFPDLVHSIKPEPHHAMPQASAAHDNFWDFASLTPEITHMLMWVLSDRALPRSYRMMEGFGVHTFRLINAAGKSRFVKFHWRPTLGTHSLVWDETQKIAGKDPDFNRRDLWNAIEEGDFPEFELGLQIVEEEDEHRFDFDLLDATKIIPEEEVPVKIVGKMTLNRNPDNFHAETEQAAFHIGNIVPGIDFTNDPLLQGRLFSYLDTQLIRLGGPNFHELPINRPVVPVHNNQRGGYMRQTINKGPVNYEPNSRGGGDPHEVPIDQGGFTSYAERIDGHKIRARSQSFQDHFSQATLFWNSLSEAEQRHLIKAAHFELGKVNDKAIRQRVLDLFNNVDHQFAKRVAEGIGVPAPSKEVRPNHGKSSPAVSMENTPKNSIRTRKVAILAADGYDETTLKELQSALDAEGAKGIVVSKMLGMLTSAGGKSLEVDKSYLTAESVLFDAIFVVGGRQAIDTLETHGDAIHFLNEAFRHCKPIGGVGEGVELLEASSIVGVDLAPANATTQVTSDRGVVTLRDAGGMGDFAKEFIAAIAQHRHWDRELIEQVPA